MYNFNNHFLCKSIETFPLLYVVVVVILLKKKSIISPVVVVIWSLSHVQLL